MNQLELLNVLDVIKNEEAYTKRLNQLKEVQAKLDKTQHIIQTVDKAHDYLDDAKAKEKKANDLVVELENSLKKVRAEVNKEYQDRFSKVNKMEAEAQRYFDEAKKALNEAKELNGSSLKKQSEMDAWYKTILQERNEMTDLKEKLHSKFYRLKQIIEET